MTLTLLVLADPLEHPVELRAMVATSSWVSGSGTRPSRSPRSGRPSGCREVVHQLQGASQGENQQHAADEQSRGARQRYPAERLHGLGLAWGQRADHDQCAERGEPSLSNEAVSMRNGPTEADGGECSADPGRQPILPLQLFQVRRTVPSAEDVRPDLDDGQVTNAARVVGQVALYREIHLSGVGHTIGSRAASSSAGRPSRTSVISWRSTPVQLWQYPPGSVAG